MRNAKSLGFTRVGVVFYRTTGRKRERERGRRQGRGGREGGREEGREGEEKRGLRFEIIYELWNLRKNRSEDQELS